MSTRNGIRPQEADETVDIQVELVLMNRLKTKTGADTESKEDKGEIIEAGKKGEYNVEKDGDRDEE